MVPYALQIVFALCLVALLFGMAGFVGYQLYGPGVEIAVPGFFGGGTLASDVAEETEDPAVETPVVSVQTAPPVQDAPATAFADASGQLFECENDRALKADFEEDTVRLALSDGRTLTLPRSVTEEGGVQYTNADGSFAFKNVEHTVFVEEGGETTYAACTATE